MKPKKTPETIQEAIKSIVDEFEGEDATVRESQIRMWKRLQLLWSGFTRIYWSEVAHDWRVSEDINALSADDQSYYDKNINIFKAYLESIIAAMSATVPGVRCKPEDADSVSDVLTAKGGTKISEIIYQHNDAPLLWMKALFVYCTQGMVAAWNYSEENEKYGTVTTPEYGEETSKVSEAFCPNCGNPLEDVDIARGIAEDWGRMDEFNPSINDPDYLPEPPGVLCETCQEQVIPQIQDKEVIVTRIVGSTHKPKSRQKIVVEGGLYVKVANYARRQEETPYLSYSYETHYSFVYSRWPHLRKDDRNRDKDTTQTGGWAGGNEIYERWGRLSPQYAGEYPLDTPTIRHWWLRPCAYEVLSDENLIGEMKKKFPHGCYAIFVNDTFVEARDQGLDDCWTLTYNPLSESIHFDPLGLMITSIQEITNDLMSLTLQTIEHGIPQTFADPQVLNFEQYRKHEVAPGSIFPARAKSGKSIGEGFYEVKTATLSGEIMPFSQKVQELGQFLSGAMPSVFGGDQSNSSRTASQYAMSRSQALQRLQTPWKMLTYWWKDIFGKSIPAYIQDMLEDEKLVKSNGDGWINILIRRAEMDGKIGSVELEAADDLPMTTAQVKDIIMQLMQMNNPEILEALGAPQNLPLIAQAIGLYNFHLPHEDDREKQLEEIQMLLRAVPISDIDPMTMQPVEHSTIQPELLVDKHDVEAEVCREWLVGEPGRQAKVTNPEGYRNILLHLQEHMQAGQQLMQMFAPPVPEQESSQGKANPKKSPKGTVMGQTTSEETGNARVQ